MWLAIGTGLWMKKWMKLFWQVAGAGEHSLSLNLIAAQMFSSLCFLIVPQKNRRQKRPLKIGGQPFSQPASDGEKSFDKIKEHIRWKQRSGGNIPLVTANSEWMTLADFHPTHQHTTPTSLGVLWWATDRGFLSNRGLPQNFYLWGLTERET